MGQRSENTVGVRLLSAYVSFVLAFALLIAAFFTCNWLASADRSLKLGLWELCIRPITFPEHLVSGSYVTGDLLCRWLDRREDVILKLPFKIVQELFNWCLVFLTIASLVVLSTLVMAIINCGHKHYKLLFGISLLIAIAAKTGMIAVFVFGTKNYWIPDPERHSLSWSYALAVVGVCLLWVAAVLFFVEGLRLRKKERTVEKSSKSCSAFCVNPRHHQHTMPCS